MNPLEHELVADECYFDDARDDRFDPEPATCPECGSDLEWDDCWGCGGDGWIDEYEDDPINYSEGEEYRRCPICMGEGGVLECPNIPHKNLTEAVTGGGSDAQTR